MTQFMLKKGDCKDFKTIEEQLKILEDRGLLIPDKENALDVLSRTNYYRFSAYSLTLRTNDVFHKNVSFDDIYELYRFDDAFRKIIIAYTSYIEIALRSYVSYEHGKKYGPLGYMNSENYSNVHYFAQQFLSLTKEIARSDDIFVEHHKRDRNSVFPIWVALECCSFGYISKMFKNLLPEDKMHISKKYFNASHGYISNWLQICVFARNIAAHGGRFYNRTFKSVSLKLPKKYKSVINANKPFAMIYAMHKLLPTRALANSFRSDLRDIINKYPFVKIEHLGFPDNWEEILLSEENKYSFEYHVNEQSINKVAVII